jgi:hypothetical protein
MIYRARVGMAVAHVLLRGFSGVLFKNFVIHGFNSIHAQAHIPKTNAEKKSFAGCVLCWSEFTRHRHEGMRPQFAILTTQEEKYLFVDLEKRVPGSMVANSIVP